LLVEDWSLTRRRARGQAAGCQRLAREGDVPATTACCRLLRLSGAWVKKVRFEHDRVVVFVALRPERLVCSLTWRLEIHARRRRLCCPEHGVRAQGPPDQVSILGRGTPRHATIDGRCVQGRGPVKENTAGETRAGRRAGVHASGDLERVRRVALQDRDGRLTALLHHVTVERLAAWFWALRPGAAAGVDGVTWREYEVDLAGNLRDLHARVHCGAF
jgi:hypothetical protein